MADFIARFYQLIRSANFIIRLSSA